MKWFCIVLALALLLSIIMFKRRVSARILGWAIFSIIVLPQKFGFSAPTAINEADVPKKFFTVEVAGALKGSGTLVLLNGVPVIMTNHHILQDHQPKVTLFPGLLKTYPYPSDVVFSSPADDVDFLSIPPVLTSEGLKDITRLAAANGEFITTKSKDGCRADFRSGPGKMSSPTELVASLDGLAQSMPPLAPWSAGEEDDLFVNGDYNYVISLPTYLRPGVSGGAYYDHGELKGLITEVSTDGEASAIAIPMSGIAKVLCEPHAQRYRAAWKDGRLTVHDGSDILVSGLSTAGNARAGGAYTGGGGAYTGGGSHNSPYWHLKVTDPLSIGLRDVHTLSPFNAHSSALQLNGRKVAYLEIRDSTAPGGKVFRAASIASYLWYKHHLPPGTVTPMFVDDPNALKELQRARAKEDEEIPFGRLYWKQGNAYEVMGDQRRDTRIDDMSQALFPKYDLNPGNIGGYEIEKQPRTSHDSDGYLIGYPYSTRETHGLILDVKIDGAFLPNPRSDDKLSSLIVQVPTDKSRIILTYIEKDRRSGKKRTSQTLLLPKKSDESGTVFYMPGGNECDLRAAMTFKAEDYSKVERLWIDVKSSIFEFLNCRPGKDCKR